MFFSIIIPAYNCERTIKRCLTSVLHQNFRDFEVIIVDDGSTDSTGKLCKSFSSGDNRFFYYYKENGGVSSARNFGLSKAVGRYVAFLDSDDAYRGNFLSAFHDQILKYPTIEHFWCGYQYLSDEGKEGRVVTVDCITQECVFDRTQLMTLHEKEMLAPLWNKVFFKETLEKHHIRMPADLSLGEDLIFNMEYLNCCINTEIVVLKEANYGYYDSSEESLNKKYRKDLWQIYNLLLDKMAYYLRTWGVTKEQREKYYTTAFYMYDCVLRNTFCKQNTENTISKIRYNNHILKSRRFRRVLQLCHVRVNGIYFKLFRFGHYELLLVADVLIQGKKQIIRIGRHIRGK